MKLFGGVEQAEFATFRAQVESRLGAFASFQALIEDRVGTVERNITLILNEHLPALELRIVQTAAESASGALEALNAAKQRRTELDQVAQEMHSAYEQIEDARGTLVSAMEEVSSLKDKFLEDADALTSRSTDSLRLHDSVTLTDADARSAAAAIQVVLQEAKEILQEAEGAPAEVDALRKFALEANAQNENIKSLLSHSLKRKGELDDLHRQVFGHEIKDDDGNVERVDGLKDELSKSYDALSSRISELDDEADGAIKQVDASHAKLREAQSVEFAGVLEDGRSSLSKVSDQLKALLPGALAAGLSAAYESKKEEEATSLSSHERNFKYAVYGLVGISIIPFAVNSYLLLHGAELANVLKDTPRLVLSILPLYFPVLWLAYSANKRLNLSKRLIEEYTHKAVLGKTFSGLSHQIDGLSNEGTVKDELRTRLLFNVLQVSAENPGKLITDYSKADHPLMDVLEKSARLSESVDALSKIPGLGSIAKALSTRRDSLIREQKAKIDSGLAANEELEAKPAELTS